MSEIQNNLQYIKSEINLLMINSEKKNQMKIYAK